MSHLARSSASPRHLLRDAVSGHLVFPWRRNRAATWLRHGVWESEELSGDIEETGTDSDGNDIVTPLAMSQSDIAACVQSGLASAWPAVSVSGIRVLVSVEPQPSGSYMGPLRWRLTYQAYRFRLSNAGLVGIESMSATVSDFYADAGAGALYLGWRYDAGSDDAPFGIPAPSDMDGLVAVTGDATIPVVSSPTAASSFEIYGWVEGGVPPAGPYNRRAYVGDGEPHYKYGASFYATLDARVIVNQ